MIVERMHVLFVISGHLLKMLESTCRQDMLNIFDDLCNRNHVSIHDSASTEIKEIYYVDLALDYLQDVLKSKKWLKNISYNRIAKIVDSVATNEYYSEQAFFRSELILMARKEIEIIIRFIGAIICKYNKICMNAGEMDIHLLCQAFDDINKAVRHVRKIIIMMPSIVKKMFERCYPHYV